MFFLAGVLPESHGFSHNTAPFGESHPYHVYSQHDPFPYSSNHDHNAPFAVFAPVGCLDSGSLAALPLRRLQPKSIIPASYNLNNLAMSPVGIHPPGIPGRISPFRTSRLQRHGLQTQSAIPGDTLLSGAVTSLVTDDPRISFPAWNTEIASTLFTRQTSSLPSEHVQNADNPWNEDDTIL